MYANLTRTIETLNPCPKGLAWIRGQTDARSAWRKCSNPDYLMWLVSVLMIRVGAGPTSRAFWARMYRRRGLPESFVSAYEVQGMYWKRYCQERDALTPAQLDLIYTSPATPTCADVRAVISEDAIVNALIEQARKSGLPIYTSPEGVRLEDPESGD